LGGMLAPRTGAAAESITITNFPTYVNVHFISTPNKNNFLQGAWVYPSNVVHRTGIAWGYTNLLWTNLTSWPSLPTASHVFYNDYSITNRVTNRFRIYRQK